MLVRTVQAGLLMAALCGWAPISLAAGSDTILKVGDVASYDFRTPLLNGPGIGNLADLHGKPVFVEYWSTG
jgi:hypothetical protein